MENQARAPGAGTLDERPAGNAGELPFWARPKSVLIIVGIWCVLHAIIGAFLESAINVDDAIESYLVQSLELTYVPRNPPFFDWLLYGLQVIVGPGRLGFAILRYALLFACAALVYRVAQRIIRDPRLQAAAVYSLSALWVVGYHSHRILTHSNVMIVAIAGAMLTLIAIARRPSTQLYAGLGAWIAVGLLGKFGFAAFLGVLVVSCLLEPTYRRAVLDRRILVTALVAAGPLAVYGLALHVLGQDVVEATAQTIGATNFAWDDVVQSYVVALVGYALPFIALAALIFLPWNRGEGACVGMDGHRDAARRVLRNVIIIGLLVTLVSVVAVGTTNLRDRYFHVFLLLLPVYVFAELERMGGWRQRVAAYLGILLAIAVGVLVVRVAIPLWPDPRLCGRCVAAEPLHRLAPTVMQALGPAPTLVADDRTSAGRLRAAIPDARVVVVGESQYRPPARPASGCARITGIANGLPFRLLPPPGRNTVEMSVKWSSPLMNPHRWSDWQFTPLPPDDPLCR
ncbi:glycosyltransferase family 39 protein [Xanthobacter sediminis]|uniref:glycosyltransferase family 39 protein n=1 Tax=Xanthobacter sediminis TaxID=3119926 RepID=UPI00372AB86C